jgi:hypothetical protein
MCEYATKVLQEQKGLKLTCSGSVEVHVCVKVVYGTNEEGHHTVTLLQDQPIEKIHAAFKELLDKRGQVRTTEIKVPMRTSFKPTDKHEVDIHDHRAVAEMKRWPYRQILGHIMWICMTHPECRNIASGERCECVTDNRSPSSETRLTPGYLHNRRMPSHGMH